MTTAPNLEAFQDFSKQQIEAFTAASATFTKGLQEIAAESTDYSKKAFAAASRGLPFIEASVAVCCATPPSPWEIKVIPWPCPLWRGR